jgi:transposase
LLVEIVELFVFGGGECITNCSKTYDNQGEELAEKVDSLNSTARGYMEYITLYIFRVRTRSRMCDAR